MTILSKHTQIQTRTYINQKGIPKDMSHTDCQKLKSRVPSGQPPFLSIFPPPHPSFSISTSLCHIYLCLQLLFPSQFDISNSDHTDIAQKSAFKRLSLAFSGPLLSNPYFLKHSPSLCLCIAEVKHKLVAYSGLEARGHWSWPPAHGTSLRRDFPARSLSLSLYLSVSE